MNGRYAEAVPVLDSYLTRHPDEQVALFAAVFAQYHVATRERLAVSAADQAKLARYVRVPGRISRSSRAYLEILRR